MDEKELITKWNKEGYAWLPLKDGNLLLAASFYIPNIEFNNKTKEVVIENDSMKSHISMNILNLINETVEWLGWNK